MIDENNIKDIEKKLKEVFEDDMVSYFLKLINKEIPKEVGERSTNRGLDMFGEYDISSYMTCPNESCNEAVGDIEDGDLWSKYCPDCGQKLKYTESEE